ncbi:MAG: cupin domain-containing protein [Desulfobacca sp.]|nr:cupin domain-containing protein [Desulfobacca sp.]
MLRKHFTAAEPVAITHSGFKGLSARYVLTSADGCPHFAMRVMEFEPQGHTSLHAHLEEHEIFVIEGEPLYIDANGQETRLQVGDAVYVPPEEPHQLINVGQTTMRLLCLIPILPGANGRSTTPCPITK